MTTFTKCKPYNMNAVNVVTFAPHTIVKKRFAKQININDIRMGSNPRT